MCWRYFSARPMTSCHQRRIQEDTAPSQEVVLAHNLFFTHWGFFVHFCMCLFLQRTDMRAVSISHLTLNKEANTSQENQATPLIQLGAHEQFYLDNTFWIHFQNSLKDKKKKNDSFHNKWSKLWFKSFWMISNKFQKLFFTLHRKAHFASKWKITYKYTQYQMMFRVFLSYQRVFFGGVGEKGHGLHVYMFVCVSACTCCVCLLSVQQV